MKVMRLPIAAALACLLSGPAMGQEMTANEVCQIARKQRIDMAELLAGLFKLSADIGTEHLLKKTHAMIEGVPEPEPSVDARWTDELDYLKQQGLDAYYAQEEAFSLACD